MVLQLCRVLAALGAAEPRALARAQLERLIATAGVDERPVAALMVLAAMHLGPGTDGDASSLAIATDALHRLSALPAEHLVAADPHGRYYDLWARLCTATGDAVAARRHLSRAIAASPASASAWARLAAHLLATEPALSAPLALRLAHTAVQLGREGVAGRGLRGGAMLGHWGGGGGELGRVVLCPHSP